MPSRWGATALAVGAVCVVVSPLEAQDARWRSRILGGYVSASGTSTRTSELILPAEAENEAEPPRVLRQTQSLSARAGHSIGYALARDLNARGSLAIEIAVERLSVPVAWEVTSQIAPAGNTTAPVRETSHLTPTVFSLGVVERLQLDGRVQLHLKPLVVLLTPELLELEKGRTLVSTGQTTTWGLEAGLSLAVGGAACCQRGLRLELSGRYSDIRLRLSGAHRSRLDLKPWSIVAGVSYGH